jgi:hypothetical protein
MNKLRIDNEDCVGYPDLSHFDCWTEELFQKVFPKGEVGIIGKNHGWAKRDGHKPVAVYGSGTEAIRACFPKTDDVLFRVYERKDSEYGHHIAVTTAHHDVPVLGTEWSYLLRPSKFEKAMGVS